MSSDTAPSQTLRRRTRPLLLADFKAVEIFVSVVQTRSITKAAHREGVAASTVSKKLAELEARAGARLLSRTTRRVAVTETGQRFYEHCLRIAEEIEAAESHLRETTLAPAGRLRVAAPIVFGTRRLAPMVAAFLKRYPGIKLELVLSPRTMDMVEEGFDLAIRLATAGSYGPGARLLARNRRVFCAAPAYLARFGEPDHPADLALHACLIAAPNLVINRWPYLDGRRVEQVRVSGPLLSDNVEVLRCAAVDGAGVALLGSFAVAEELQAGTLQEVLRGYAVQDSVIVAALPHRSFVPRRVHLLIEFLAERIGDPPTWERLVPGWDEAQLVDRPAHDRQARKRATRATSVRRVTERDG